MLLDNLATEALALVGGERGFVMLRRGGGLEFKVVRNWSREDLEQGKDSVSRTIALEAIERGEGILVEDALADSRYAERDSVLRNRIRSVLAAPLVVDGEAVGALYLENSRIDSLFGEAQLLLFRQALDLASNALRQATRRLLLEEENRRLARRSLLAERFPGLLTRDPRFLEVLETVTQAAATDSTVLLLGESGTGKELVARAVHRNSSRATRPFITVNCGALTPTLMESEMFGHVRGSFTGAHRDAKGRVASADGGTLFLDEVGELPLELQVKLLRLLQSGELQPVGAERPHRVDVRFVAATNQNLEAEVAAGRFREDLFYRLHVVTFELPPIRHRPSDVLHLFFHFLHRFAEKADRPVPEVTAAVESRLAEYSWPGNVRQLENEAERLIAIAPQGEALCEEHLSPQITASADPPAAATLESSEKLLIRQHLELSGGNKSRAARTLGISREGLRKKMKRLGLG